MAMSRQPVLAAAIHKCLFRKSRMIAAKSKTRAGRCRGLAFAAKTWFSRPMRPGLLRCLAVFALGLALVGPAVAMPDWQWERRNSGSSRLPVRADHYAEDICRIIAREAHRRMLPP